MATVSRDPEKRIVTIDMGSDLSLQKMDDLLEDLLKLENEIVKGDDVIFDFRKSEYVSPSVVAVIIFIRDKIFSKCNSLSARVRTQTSFFRFGKVLGVFNTKELDKYMTGMIDYAVKVTRCYSFEECQDVVLEIRKKIKKRTNCSQSTLKALQFMIDEICDNAGSHGYSCYDTNIFPKPVYMTAFSYKDRVEVAILDGGIGIHKHLKANEKYREISARESLKRVIEEGVSGHPKSSPGYGLYLLSKFTASVENGSFSIWSSGRKLVIKNGHVNIKKCGFYDGTLVSFQVYKNVDIPFDDLVPLNTSENYQFLFELGEENGD